jgi:SAM-dependent methyltransferase
MPKTLSLKLGGFLMTASLGRAPDTRFDAFVRKLELGYAHALEARFPILKSFSLLVTEANAAEIAAFYAAYLPLINEESRSAATRSLLKTLMNNTADDALKRVAAEAIAKSDLGDGMAERALLIRHLPGWAAETEAWERAYGAPIITTDWASANRGASLLLYFKARPDLWLGKDVLHVAPEPAMENWMKSAGTKRYISVDGQYAAGEHHDITSLGYPSGSFDLVICHRVMEHVLDDTTGFSELHRVLKPGGLLNFSVPQAPQRAKTKEWAVPDKSHDGHVRQYGADLVERMQSAGFSVEIEPWLLNRPHEELRANKAYPMRMFNARRPLDVR